ncbi:hypothetical protein FQN50_009276 [Emmonsiellopsis sp. PD_5]|nr:hypothetical protein FQN50_009276 [Emmonsiellopsis sp. PD_5]
MPPAKRAKRPSATTQPPAPASPPPAPTSPTKPNPDPTNDQPHDQNAIPSPLPPPPLLAEDEEDEEEAILPPSPSPQGQPHPTTTGPPTTTHPGYNALKTFKGQYYTGMAVGGSHTWNYEPGVWRETKEEPDLWRVEFETRKRRAGGKGGSGKEKERRAPEGSGAEVGVEFHWVVVAHQYVKKIDANTYETHLTGSKYKLAHKAASSNTWSVPTVKAQREREVEILEDAKRRVLGLPPVLGGEKVRVERREKGQRRVDELFGVGKGGGEGDEVKKRKRGEG